MSYSIRDMERQSAKKLFSVVSTFAGGGGSSVGYKMSGANVLLANEISPDAVKIYKRNHTNTKVIEGDIKNVKVNLNDIDILDGSPPCITFSVAKAKKRDADTEESITENLVVDYLRLVKDIKPKVCVIENVRQFQYAPVFKETVKELKQLGYILNHKVLNSVDYGVPQIRLRLFVIAVRKDIAKKKNINDENLLDLFPKPYQKKHLTVRDALKGLSIRPEERDLLLSSMRKTSHYEVLKYIPKNPPKKTRMSHLKKDWNSDFSLDRASWDKPSPTLTSLGQQLGRGGICHPEEDRLFTVNELSRLMGLPDDYSFSGTFNEKVKTIGNMVPPQLTRLISESIYNKVLK